MSRTDTTDFKGVHTPVGYGAGNMDPHQMGFMGEMASNMNVKKPANRKRLTGHRLGYPNY